MSDKQRITIVEVNQGFCTRTYGTAPCTAALGTTGNHKCFNTEATCQDPAHYDGDPNAVPYLSVPAVATTNSASTPDSVATSITGDIDIRMKIALGDWSPASGIFILNKMASAIDRAYRLSVQSAAGTLMWEWSTDGTTGTLTNRSSTVAVSFADGTPGWVRVTHDVDNGAGSNTVTFYTSTDGITWTQLGATVTSGGPTSIFNAVGDLQLVQGSAVTTQNLYYFELRNGINGPVVAKFDPPFNDAAYDAPSFVSETGERWFINKGGTPCKLISPALQLRFTQPQDGISQYGLMIPSLQSVGITPAEVNLAAMERNAGALGQREVLAAAMIDHQHSDLLLDRYRLERETGVASTIEAGTAAAYGALSFDGAGTKRVTVPYNVSLDIANSLSVECWLTPDTSLLTQGYVEKTIGGLVNTQYLLFGEGGTFALRLKPAVGGINTANSTTGAWTASNGVLTHLVGVWDGVNIQIYVNGVASGAAVAQAGPLATGVGGILLAQLGTGAGPYNAKGTMDEVRIYNRALTPQEVAMHSVGIYENETGLVGFWAFEENSGTVALDQSPTLNNGTLVGAPARVAGRYGRKNVIKLRAAASAVDDFYKGKNVRINSGTGNVQTRLITAYNALTHLATVDRDWVENYIVRSEDASLAFGWAIGDPANPFTPNSADIAAPDGTFTATKWTLNQTAGVNRSFTPSYNAMPALPGSTICWSFYVWIPSTNSNNPFTAYCFSNTEIPTQPQMLDLNKLPRNQWVLASWVHTWGAASTANVNPQFHSNSADTLGDKMYVWKPKLNYGTSRGEYLKTLGSTLAPDGTSVYVVYEDAYQPISKGTFWGKWIARNPYYSAFPVTMREGLVGQLLSAMRVHKYSIDRFEGPTAGAVSMVAKDLFTKIEQRKSVAPLASNGRLLADITNVAGTATLTPAGVGNLEYPASGFVVISEEEMSFTRAGDVLTLTRPTSNTAAAAHKADDLVQLVLVYTPTLVKDIVYNLLSVYTELLVSQLPLTEWTAAMTAVTELYSTHVCTPTPVLDLVGELSEQAGFTVFPNTVTGLIKMVPLRAGASTATIDDAKDMRSGSVSVKRQDSRRASQVWVYYGQRNPVKSLSEKSNYASRTLNVSLAAETQYGTPAIREVFSRWIPSGGRATALKTGGRMLELFRNPPIEAQFRVMTDDWDSQLSLAQFITPMIDEIQDDTGNRLATTAAILSIERDDDELAITTQEVSLIPEDPAAERFIYIDNDSLNLNMRTIHDTLYAAPVGTETIRFVISAGVYVGSASLATYALRTGSWPAGVTLRFDCHGICEGKAGNGGAGGRGNGSNPPDNGSPGQTGGDALFVEYALSIDNLDGSLWGGGGGGGGGGGSVVVGSGGGGGGAGAGYDTGTGGQGGQNTTTPLTYEASGANGTRTTAGTGAPGFNSGGGYVAGSGGQGGGPGLPGTAGTNATKNPLGPSTPGTGGAAGPAGKYVVGNSLVTWINNGDRRGGVA